MARLSTDKDRRGRGDIKLERKGEGEELTLARLRKDLRGQRCPSGP